MHFLGHVLAILDQILECAAHPPRAWWLLVLPVLSGLAMLSAALVSVAIVLPVVRSIVVPLVVRPLVVLALVAVLVSVAVVFTTLV